MQRLTEILATSMGGYAVYVWPAFLLTGLVMLAITLTSLRSLRRANHTLRQLQAGAAHSNES